MSYDEYPGQESIPGLPLEERPTFQDLQRNAAAGPVGRGVARYLFSRNPERSIKVHTYLGAPLVRAAIMGTYGRLIPRSGSSNFRTDPSKSRLEAATRFAVGGSVFNEALHTAAAGQNLDTILEHMADGHSFTRSAIALGLNAALISVQRLNRAKMALRIDEELKAGATYSEGYQNYLGIDHRAVANYQTTLANSGSGGDLPNTTEILDITPPTAETYPA